MVAIYVVGTGQTYKVSDEDANTSWQRTKRDPFPGSTPVLFRKYTSGMSSTSLRRYAALNKESN